MNEAQGKNFIRLRLMTHLPAGWNSYDARPIAREAIRYTAALVLLLAPHEQPYLVPGPDGTVICEWEGNGYFYEISIDAQGRIGSLLSADDQHDTYRAIERGWVPFGEMLAWVRWVRRRVRTLPPPNQLAVPFDYLTDFHTAGIIKERELADVR